MKALLIALLLAVVSLGGVARAQAPVPVGDDLDAPVELPADGLVGALTDPLVRVRARPIGDGWAFAGEWTALHVRLDNLGEALTGELVVRTGAADGTEHVHRRIVELAAGSRRELSLPYLAGRRSGSVQVDFLAGRRSVSTQIVQRILGDDDVLIGVIGDDAAGLTALNQTISGKVPASSPRADAYDDQPREVRVGMLSLRGLPDRSYVYRSFSQIVWVDPDPSGLTPGQLQALRHHVADGGHLVITTTERWRQLAGSPLADLLPARPVGLTDSLAAAELAGRLGYRSGEQAPMAELRLSRREGRDSIVAASHLDEPTWVIGTYGLGTVTVVGLDPRGEPLGPSYIPEAKFWRSILHLPPPGDMNGTIVPGRGPAHERVAYNLGLAGSLLVTADDEDGLTMAEATVIRTFLRDIPGVEPIPLTWLIGFSALYLILIGPVDYLVLRWLRREILTWITFPVMIVIFSGLALVGITWFKGSQAVVTRIEVVDALPGTDLWRGDALYGLWATQRAPVRLRAGHEGGLAAPMTGQGYLVDPKFQADQSGDGASFVLQTWALGFARTAWTATRPGELRLSGPPESPTLHNDLPFDVEAALCRGSARVGLVRLPAGAAVPLTDELDTVQGPFDGTEVLSQACMFEATGRASLLSRRYARTIVAVRAEPIEPFELTGLDPEPVNLTVFRFPVLPEETQESTP